MSQQKPGEGVLYCLLAWNKHCQFFHSIKTIEKKPRGNIPKYQGCCEQKRKNKPSVPEGTHSLRKLGTTSPRKHHPRDATYKVHIVQGTHRTRDASYEGHIVLGTNRTRDTLYTGLIVQGAILTLYVMYKGGVVQEKHRTRDASFRGCII
jgi:hypothetical protein